MIAYASNVPFVVPSIVLSLVGYARLKKIIEYNKNEESLRALAEHNSLGEFVRTHKVKLLTNEKGLGLRKGPYPLTDAFIRIPDGTAVQHLGTGAEVNLKDKEGFWFDIRTSDGVRGWCFSGSLEKI